MSRSQQIERDGPVFRREPRPAFFAGPRIRLEYRSGGVSDPPPRRGAWSKPRPPGVAHAPAAGVHLGATVRGIVRVESRELTLTRTTTMSVPCTRARTVSCRPSRIGSSRCARRRQCLGAARRPRGLRDAAAGIDRSCAQRVFRAYVMADVEWLTLTQDFTEAYSADISLVSSWHRLRIPKCGACGQRYITLSPRTQQNVRHISNVQAASDRDARRTSH